MKVKIRNAVLGDVREIVELEKKAWPEGLYGDEEKFISRITIFPEGVLVAVLNGKIVGVVVVQIIDYDINHPIPTWYEATDNGFIRKSHNPMGNTVYGVDLSVSPEVQNIGTARKLLQEIGKMAIRHNLEQGVLGGRIPSYYKYSKEMTAEEYIKAKTETGELLDPEVRFYVNSDLELVKLMPDYFSDYESKNYGILLRWKNPFYLKNNFLGRLLGIFFSFLFRI